MLRIILVIIWLVSFIWGIVGLTSIIGRIISGIPINPVIIVIFEMIFVFACIIQLLIFFIYGKINPLSVVS